MERIEISEISEMQESDLNFQSDDSPIDINQLPENQVNYELSRVVKAENKADNSIDVQLNHRLPELHESAEPESTQRSGRYNLRKSLAWDSAFFTSSGVLDPEELSSMITGPNKAEKQMLPKIEEDMTGSLESISSIQSDNLTLESFEDDLFVDIRASIQRSSKKKSILTNSSNMATTSKIDNEAISALKKEDPASQDKNLKPVSKKTSGLKPVVGSKFRSNNLGKPGSGKVTLKQDSIVSQSTAKIVQSNPIHPKPTKAINKLNIRTSMDSTKRDSTSIGRAKYECGSLKLTAGTSSFSNKTTQPPKTSIVRSSVRGIPKPGTVSSKSSFLGSSTTTRVQSTRSSTSSDSSTSISSKSPPLTARRNLVKSSNYGSLKKSPSVDALKNKPPLSKISTKICSGVSPASSISDWSSVSSSSSSVVIPRSNNSRTSLDVNSSMDRDVNPRDLKSHTTNSNGNGNNLKKSSAQTNGLQTLAKPSGLRLPSPKIGFFDGVKSPARTPNEPQRSQSVLQGIIPNSGVAVSSLSRSSNIKSKSSKVPKATTLTNIKPGSPKQTSPTSLLEKSHASGNDYCISTVANDSPTLALEVKDNATGQYCQNAEKIQVKDGVNQLEDTAAGTITNNYLCDLEKEINPNMQKFVSGWVLNNATIEGSNSSGSKHDAYRGDQDFKNSSNPVCKIDDKENAHVISQGDGLKGHDRIVTPTFSRPMDEVLNEIFASALSYPTTSKSLSLLRSPFSLKNVSEINDCTSVFNESAIKVADERAFALPEKE